MLLLLSIILACLTILLIWQYYLFKKKVATELQEKSEEIQIFQTLLQEKNEELESYVESNIRLSQFAYVASHDLKSSLNTIKSFTGLLQSSIGDLLGPQEKKYFYYIEQAATLSETLVMDTLYYSQIQNTPIEKKEIDTSKLIKSVLVSLQQLINNKQAEIKVGFLPITIHADEKQLRKALEHIIINSLKFVPSTRTPFVRIASEEKEEEWIFEIQDNGMGIIEENQSIIFNEFIKLNDKYEYTGSGFGLPISKNIIEKHGGNIWIESSSSEGTTLIFTLNKWLLNRSCNLNL